MFTVQKNLERNILKRALKDLNENIQFKNKIEDLECSIDYIQSIVDPELTINVNTDVGQARLNEVRTKLLDMNNLYLELFIRYAINILDFDLIDDLFKYDIILKYFNDMVKNQNRKSFIDMVAFQALKEKLNSYSKQRWYVDDNLDIFYDFKGQRVYIEKINMYEKFDSLRDHAKDVIKLNSTFFVLNEKDEIKYMECYGEPNF